MAETTMPITTRDVARAIGRTRAFVHALITTDRMPEPPKDSSGRFIWTPELIEAARRAAVHDRRLKGNRARRGGPVNAA
jgi:hypothetical protein